MTSAEDRVNMGAKMAQIRHAHLTDFDSCLTGQKRSKKKAAPKMVATKTPTKILYDAAPM